ncbi:glycine betaine ABC transporter substrate-binding protein [Halanaerobaculum tunisiense]
MTKESKLLVLVILLISSILLLVGCGGTKKNNAKSKTDKGTIKIGMNNWAENIAICNMWKILLEEQGYDVEIFNGRKAPIWAGLEEGSIDFYLDVWLPKIDAPYWKKYKDDLKKYGPWFKNTGMGLVVPEYVDVDTIEELKNNKGKFMKSGEPTIVGADAGASVMRMTKDAIKEYDLDYELMASSGPAMTSALKRAYQKKEPIVVTLWNPHWVFAEFDLKYLKDPNHIYGKSEDAFVVANNDSAKQYPEVIKSLKKWKMDDQSLGELMSVINKSDDAQQGVQEWVDNNRELVNQWLD